jgi:hypothetical protein
MVVFDGHEYLTEEERRLKEDRKRQKYWKKWGPYTAERQWATGEFSHSPYCLATTKSGNCIGCPRKRALQANTFPDRSERRLQCRR